MSEINSILSKISEKGQYEEVLKTKILQSVSV